MKKLIVSVLITLTSAALFAKDTDMYLYWMIDEGASFDGKTLSDLSGYTARVSDGSGYLCLYSDVDTTTMGKSISANDAFGWENYAGIGDSLAGTFFVELLNDTTVAYTSEAKSYSELAAYMSPMTGQATPADAYKFSTFTSAAPVPEPSSGLMLLLGMAGLALRRRKTKRA